MKIRDTVSWYGCRRDTKDARDHMFVPKVTRMPVSVDLEASCPPVLDQGQLGSCVWHGTSTAIRHDLIAAGMKDVEFSRLQGYYDTRAIEGTIRSDAGCEIRDAIKTLAKNGVAHEPMWPYAIKKFATKPPAKVYKDALDFRALAYERVQVSTSQVKAAIAGGQPVIIGLTLYDSFESEAVAKNGIVPMPKRGEEIVGGHCMCVIGYGQKKGYFKVRNSWATDWGDRGNCWMPEAYIGSPLYGSDYWIVSTFGK